MSTGPTIRDVAALAGVSVGTVSNTINCPELVSSTKRKLVQDAVTKLGWTPDGHAQRLASKDVHATTGVAPKALRQGAEFFRGEVVLDIDAGSQAAHELAVQLAAQQAAIELTDNGQTRLTLQLRADTVEQAALWLLGLVLPLNRRVLRLQVMGAAEDA